MSDYPKFIKLGMSDCVLSIHKDSFPFKMNGFYTFNKRISSKGEEVCFLDIHINSTICKNTHALKIKKHRAVAHEFTHCVAALLSLGRILSKKLFDKLITDLTDKVQVNSRFHLQELLLPYTNKSSILMSTLGIYPDSHFRLGYEDFPCGYTTFYKNLILDRTIFEKYFTPDKQEEFISEIKKNNITQALSILTRVVIDAQQKECISEDFMKMRLKEELVIYYYKKALL